MDTKERNAIGWLSSGHFVCDVYGGFLNPIMPFIAAKLGFTMAIATLIIGIAQICSNMLQPIFGFFADNILKRFFVFWGLILASIFIPLASNAPNLYVLTIFMILGSLGGSFYHPQAMGFVKRFSSANYADNMGFFISMGSAGFALGPLLATYIVQFVGLEKVSYASIIGITLACSMFLFVPKISLTDKKPEHKKFIKTFSEILKNHQMNLLLLIAMMKSLVTTSCSILLPFLWKDLGHSAFYIGCALFLFIFAGAIGSYFSPKLEKRFNSKVILYFSMCATFPLMYLFSLLYKNAPLLSLVIFGIIGFTTMLAQPVIIVIAQKLLPEYKSIVAGFINGFCWGIIALVLAGLGLVAQKYGILNVLITVSLIPVIASYSIKYLKVNNI